jgi:hypothetical protein
MRLVFELRSVDAAANSGVTQSRELAFDRSGQFRDDHKMSPLLLEPVDERAIVKPLVSPDNYALSRIGAFGEASLKQSLHATSRVRISWPQFPVPVIFGLSFETQQWMIGPATTFDWIVTCARSFLLPIEHQHRRVDVEDKSCGRVRTVCHTPKKLIVQRAQTRQHLRRCAQQKSPQTRCVWIARKPGQVLEHAILSQKLRGLQPLESKYHRVQKRQQHLANAVSVVALFDTNMLRERIFESNSGQKAMQQINPAIVRQILRTEGDRKLAWASGHYSEPYLIGSFHCNTEKSTWLWLYPSQTHSQ